MIRNWSGFDGTFKINCTVDQRHVNLCQSSSWGSQGHLPSLQWGLKVRSSFHWLLFSRSLFSSFFALLPLSRFHNPSVRLSQFSWTSFYVLLIHSPTPSKNNLSTSPCCKFMIHAHAIPRPHPSTFCLLHSLPHPSPIPCQWQRRFMTSASHYLIPYSCLPPAHIFSILAQMLAFSI